jgi:spore coat polysaccharide biosynthesis protein SpsF (cytidylyltransferase family)
MVLQMKNLAIIQARMGSTRLPGKVLSELCNMPMLAVLIQRIKACRDIDETVVATTIDPTDDVLVDWLNQHNLPLYRGSVNDVLDRFWKCSLKHNADVIIRITADDPLKDPAIISRALSEFHARPLIDYVSNTLKPTFPEGLDIEVFRSEALEKAATEATLVSDREHVTPYIWRQPDKFSLLNFEMDPDLSSWRWTVDTPQDMLFVRKIFAHFNNDIQVSHKDIISYLLTNPDLLKINSGIKRNAGYLNTIAMEN